MYPELYSFFLSDGTEVPIATFGVCLTIAFFAFYWMLRRLGKKYDISTSFFSINLLSFFLTTFFASRLLHVILYAGLPTKSAFSTEYPILSFFLMSDFYFSAGGALLGFFWLLLFHVRNKDQEEREEIRDIAAISWVFAAIIAYFGAFLWWQVYGVRSESIFAVDYVNNPILAEYPRFPLAIVYILCTICIFSIIYIVRKIRSERWLAAALWALLWGIMWFLGEWWNDASSDNIAQVFGLFSHWKILNFNQVIALILMVWWSWRLAHIIPSPLSEWIIDIGEKALDIFWDIYTPSEKYVGRVYRKIKKYVLSLQKKIKK